MKTGFLAAMMAWGLIVSASAAQAAEESRGWVGGLVGLSVPNYTDTTARPIWGLTAGAKLGSELGLGGYYLTSSKNETSGTVSKFDYQMYGIQLSYHFEGEANGAFFGARVGITKLDSSSRVTGTTSTSPTNYGIVGGYDYMLTPNFSIGGEASFMAVDSSSENGVSIKSFTMLNFLGAAKFWF